MLPEGDPGTLIEPDDTLAEAMGAYHRPLASTPDVTVVMRVGEGDEPATRAVVPCDVPPGRTDMADRPQCVEATIERDSEGQCVTLPPCDEVCDVVLGQHIGDPGRHLVSKSVGRRAELARRCHPAPTVGRHRRGRVVRIGRAESRTNGAQSGMDEVATTRCERRAEQVAHRWRETSIDPVALQESTEAKQPGAHGTRCYGAVTGHPLTVTSNGWSGERLGLRLR